MNQKNNYFSSNLEIISLTPKTILFVVVDHFVKLLERQEELC